MLALIYVQTEYLFRILNALWDHFLRSLHHSFTDISKVKLSAITPYLSVLSDLLDTNLVGHHPSDRAKLDDIADSIRQEAFGMYSAKTTEVFGGELMGEDEGNQVEPLLKIIDWVEKQAKIFKKRFPEPLLECAHVLIHGGRVGLEGAYAYICKRPSSNAAFNVSFNPPSLPI